MQERERAKLRKQRAECKHDRAYEVEGFIPLTCCPDCGKAWIRGDGK